MYTKSIIIVTIVAVGAVLVASNPYGPTYNDGYEQPQARGHHQAQSSYQPQASYGHSYQAPAPVQAYHAAPSYQKYNAPSSAHHTQYDNYYPKQTYSKPMYAAPKPMYAPAQSYQPQPYAAAPRPAYQAPSYGAEAEYRA